MTMLHTAAQLKTYFGQASLYLSAINFILLLATVKQSYHVNISAYIIIPLGVIGTILIGWIDYHYILRHQQEHVNKQNDIKEQLDRIERRLA